MKTLAIFGSTGSIGKNALEVARLHPDSFRIRYLSTFGNTELLREQIDEFSPAAVAVVDKRAYEEIREIAGNRTEVLAGIDGLLEIARRDDYSTLVSSLVGFAGVLPTIAAIETNKDIALANKETLVAAGEIISRLLEKHNVRLVPIDSEHSAILQCIMGEPENSVGKICLTASGGPFRGRTIEELKYITREEALRHPNWRMGNKITIDSATLMNKGLEVIEAHWLFHLPGERIEVLVHPQSIVHSMVEFCDGSVKAQLGVPDMKLPIHYALTYPERIPAPYRRLQLEDLRMLTFEKPDFHVFSCLSLAYQALETGGTAPTCLNAANEIAVQAFLEGRIKFLDIPAVIKDCLEELAVQSASDIETIIAVDIQTRKFAHERITSPRKRTVTLT